MDSTAGRRWCAHRAGDVRVAVGSAAGLSRDRRGQSGARRRNDRTLDRHATSALDRRRPARRAAVGVGTAAVLGAFGVVVGGRRLCRPRPGMRGRGQCLRRRLRAGQSDACRVTTPTCRGIAIPACDASFRQSALHQDRGDPRDRRSAEGATQVDQGTAERVLHRRPRSVENQAQQVIPGKARRARTRPRRSAQ